MSGSLFAQNRLAIDSLKTAIFHAKDDTNKVLLVTALAGQYNMVDRDSAMYFLNTALNLAREINNPKFKAMAMVNLGADYCFKGDYFKSLEYLDLAENILNEFPHKSIEADLYYFKAIVYASIDQLQKANDFALKSLNLYNEINEMEMVGALYTIISGIYVDLGDKQKGFDYAEKAYLNALEREDISSIAGNLNNLGSQYHEIGNLDSAYSFMRKAIKLNKKNNNLTWLAINYHNLADYKFKEQELDSAYYYLNKAVKLYQEVGHLMNILKLIELEAKIALAKKDTVESIRLYNSILNTSAEFESLKIKVAAYKALYEIKKSQGQLHEAIDYFENYQSFDDSLTKEQSASLLSVMEMQLDYEQKHSQLELENKEVKIRSQRKNFLMIIMAVLVFLLALTFYYVYRLQQAKALTFRLEKKRMEEELEFKNREMTTNVMSLMKKNEILTEISKKLLEVEQNAVKDETKKAINTIAGKIQKTREEEIWEEFDIRFKQVHIDFYEKLVNQFPNLSPSEQRLCAFLRMNMSTKDISELIGVHPRSVDNARSKVRKKFGLTSEDNLVSFLSKI